MSRLSTIYQKIFWPIASGSVLLVLGCASLVRAQDLPPQPPPAYIAAVEGSATISRDGDNQPAVQNMPLVAGDRVRTDAGGRVEIRFPDGSGMAVDESSEIEMVSASRVRLIGGDVERLEADAPAAQSSAYLPQDLQMYGSTLDQYGSWNYAGQYGYVWYPRVAATWRPYYNGYWDAVGPYGWTWIGTDVWSWPTHHYGRWGYARGAWFWIPGRTFAPAWVAWGSALDYVSWCPLGFDNRPVFALSVGYGRSWNGWTVFPRSYFGSRAYYVQRYAVAPHLISPRATFVARDTPPLPLRGHANAIGSRTAPAGSSAVGRSAWRDRDTAGGVAVPRNPSSVPPGYVPQRRSAPQAQPGYAPQVQPGFAQPRYAPQVPRSAPQVQPAPAPEVQPRSAPQVQPGYAQPRYAQPRYLQPQYAPDVQPRPGAAPRVTPAPPVAAPIRPAPAPQAAPSAAPQRAAPPAGAPAGTATSRSNGGGEAHAGGGGHHRR